MKRFVEAEVKFFFHGASDLRLYESDYLNATLVSDTSCAFFFFFFPYFNEGRILE